MPGIKHRRWTIYRLDILPTVFCFFGTVLPNVSKQKNRHKPIIYIIGELMNNYYTLSRLCDKLTNELIVATPTDKKGWSYLIADDNGEWLRVEANLQYRITNVSFTHKYKGVGMSLKRAQTKGFKVCRYLGVASWNRKLENVN